MVFLVSYVVWVLVVWWVLFVLWLFFVCVVFVCVVWLFLGWGGVISLLLVCHLIAHTTQPLLHQSWRTGWNKK